MKITRNQDAAFVIQVAELTPVSGATIGLVFADYPGTFIPAMVPADVYQLGNALQQAAQRAGFTPPPPGG